MNSRIRLLVVATAIVVAVVIPGLLFVGRYPEWWMWIALEQTPMTWFQSVTLVLAAATSGLAWFVCRLADRTPRTGYAVLAAGFAWLAFDERFAIHERVRDGYLAPRDVRMPLLTWIAPGDFIILLVGLVGLALIPLVVRSLGRDRWALTALGVGVVLACVAVGMDSIDPSTWSVDAERIEQTLEECIEFAAGLSFLTAITLRLLDLLTSLATVRARAERLSGPEIDAPTAEGVQSWAR